MSFFDDLFTQVGEGAGRLADSAEDKISDLFSNVEGFLHGEIANVKPLVRGGGQPNQSAPSAPNPAPKYISAPSGQGSARQNAFGMSSGMNIDKNTILIVGGLLAAAIILS